MTKHILLYITAIIALLFGAGCDNKEKALYSRLQDSERLVAENPDSSLVLLGDISSKDLLSERCSALYALVKTNAEYKLGYDIESDSLINIASEYYTRKNDTRRMMISYFLESYILFTQEKVNISAIKLMNALSLAQQLKDDYWLAMIHDLYATICYESLDIKEIISQDRLAAHYFKRCGHQQNHFLELINAADAYPLINEAEKGIALIDSIRRVIEPADSFMMAVCLQSLIPIYNRIGKYEESRKAFENMRPYIHHTGYSERLCAAISDYYLNGRHLNDSAKYWIDRAYESADTSALSPPLVNAEIAYYKSTGDQKHLIGLLQKYIEQSDKTMNALFDQDFTMAQKEYYAKESLEKSRQGRKYLRLSIILFILLVVTIIIVWLYLREKRRLQSLERYTRMTEIRNLINESKQKDQEITKLNSDISDNELHMSQLNSSLSEKELQMKELAALKDEIFAMQLNTVNILCDNFFGIKTSDVDKRVIYAKVDDIFKRIFSEEGMKVLIDMLNKTHSGIMERLRSQLPNLQQSDFEFIILVYSGIRPKTACVLLNISASYFYTKRKRIIGRIAKSDAPDKELFIRMLMLPQEQAKDN